MDEHSTTTNYSEDFSDDSSFRTIESSKNSCIIPIAKHKIDSSFSSSLSLSNSSICSFDKEQNSSKCLSVNGPTNITNRNSEMHQVSINSVVTVDNEDENKSNAENTSIEIVNQNINKKNPYINMLMKKRSRKLREKDNGCQKNNNIT